MGRRFIQITKEGSGRGGRAKQASAPAPRRPRPAGVRLGLGENGARPRACLPGRIQGYTSQEGIALVPQNGGAGGDPEENLERTTSRRRHPQTN